MAFFKLTLAYDGAEFSGWQAQPDQRTVQGEVERAWLAITGETVRVTAAGRTDAGVHAAGQVVGVESATTLAPETLLSALNAKLPDDAVVRSVDVAPAGFHATHDAKSKRYRYSIYNDRRRPLVLRRYAWHVPTSLDAAAMHRAGQALVGTHDFASFQSVGSERESTVRMIFAIDVATAQTKLGRGRAGNATFAQDEEDALVTIDVEGDGFLYNMVRAIAGTLVVVGRGKRPESWIAEVVAACDRSAAGQTAPAHGLMLMTVAY